MQIGEDLVNVEAIQENSIVNLEGTLQPWLSLVGKRRNNMPTP
jgi:hypothetical protein